MLFIQTCISSVQLCSCLCLDAHDCPSSLQHIIPLGLNDTTFNFLVSSWNSQQYIGYTLWNKDCLRKNKTKKRSGGVFIKKRANWFIGSTEWHGSFLLDPKNKYSRNCLISWHTLQVHNHATVTCLTSHYCHAFHSTVNSTSITLLIKNKTIIDCSTIH